jgi:hypothetical protein
MTVGLMTTSVRGGCAGINLSGFEERLRGATILLLSAVSMHGARDAESAITAAWLLRDFCEAAAAEGPTAGLLRPAAITATSFHPGSPSHSRYLSYRRNRNACYQHALAERSTQPRAATLAPVISTERGFMPTGERFFEGC